jgi:GntR family transcriptional repressor for pyruvate dehydrogenase complex
MSGEFMETTQDELFKAIPRETTLANQVREQLEELIVERRLQPGDRLPAERELARQFGVSRTVVREAVRSLMAKGLLEVRSGSGTIVRTPSAAAAAQSMSLFLRAGHPELDYRKVLEVRSILEVEIAGLAAERGTEEDIARMEQILEDTLKATNRETYVKADIAFHSALAQATHNEMFSLLLDSVVEIMRKLREMAFDIPPAPNRAYKYHCAILEQVKKGDGDGARQAMREHLVEAEDTILRAMALYATRGLGQTDS